MTQNRSLLERQGQPAPDAIPNSFARELLRTENQVFVAFDLLARWIDQYLDYPELLIENGVQGVATLDLYFDHDGNVDEERSHFLGANRSVRGLLVRASRQGLVKWYASDSFRLKKDQFRDQHFRAEFSLSYALDNLSQVRRTAVGSYTMVRRHFVHECADPTGVDLVCIAKKTAGAVQRLASAGYRQRFEALKDLLEHFDEMGLQGVGELIKGA